MTGVGKDGTGFSPTVRRVLRIVRSQRAFKIMFPLGLASVALNVTGPLLLGRATDLALAGVVDPSTAQPAHVDLGPIVVVLLAAFIVHAVSGLCWILQGRQASTAIQRTAARLREDVEAKLSRLPVAYFDRVPRGELLSRTTNDIDNLVHALQQTISQLTNSVALIVAMLAIMFWLSPVLTLVALAVVPLTAVVIAWLGKRAQPRFREQWSATGTLLTHIEETCAGHASMTAYGRHSAVMSTFREHNEVLSRAALRASVLSGISQPAMIFLNNLGYVLVAVVGCVRVTTGALSIGTVQAFVQYSRQLSGPLAQLTGLTSVTQSGVASAQRVFEVLDADELREEADGTLPSPLHGEVRFESVYFQYDQEHPLIEGLSMSADAGQNVAVVGASGAGKTTLVNLLMRYYDADGGRITLDGVDLTTVPRRRVRSVIGAVLQDDWLFQGSIADNIGYGAEDATRAEIEEAARAAHADHIIRTLPAGYDTIVDEGCAVLSAGERQLICIARAFLSDPAVLLLDEATSLVDTRTELLVRRALTNLRKGRTSFVIAHRLSTVRDADLILVMRSGAIVESGTHDELIAARGAYAELISSQFASTGLATSGRTTDDNGRHGS